MVPMTGENYRQFLELWKEKKLTRWATMQPNWLAGFSVYVAVQGAGRQGHPGLCEGAAAGHRQQQHRRLSRASQRLPG